MSFLEYLRGGCKEFQRLRRWDAFFSKNPLAQDECGLVVQYGIGDHYIICALAKALADKTRLKIVVACNPAYGFIPKLFPSIGRSTGWPVNLAREPVNLRMNIPGRFRDGNAHSELISVLGYNHFHLLDMYKSLLLLRPDVRLETANAPTGAEMNSAREYLEQHQLPAGRTAILCTDTGVTYTGNLSPDFWKRVAAALTEAGIVPVQNMGPASISIPGIRPMPFPLAQFRAIAVAAGYFYSVRSGICDLVCDLDCLRTVIYPKREFWFGTVFNLATFSKFGLLHPPDEIVLEEGAEEELFAKIKKDVERQAVP